MQSTDNRQRFSGERWLLATGMGIFVFWAMIYRFRAQEWYDPSIIALIAFAAGICGWLFAEFVVTLILATFGESQTPAVTPQAQAAIPDELASPAIEIQRSKFTFIEFIHLAAIGLAGFRWGPIRAGCIAFAVATPITAVLVGYSPINASPWPLTVIAPLYLFGLFVGLAFVLFSEIVILAWKAWTHLIPFADGVLSVSVRGMEFAGFTAQQVRYEWSGNQRWHESSKVLVLEDNGKWRLALAKRLISPRVVKELRRFSGGPYAS